MLSINALSSTVANRRSSEKNNSYPTQIPDFFEKSGIYPRSYISIDTAELSIGREYGQSIEPRDRQSNCQAMLRITRLKQEPIASSRQDLYK
jgi:hypothetical protein